MKEFISLKISRHAIDRYRERVGPLPESQYEATIRLFAMLAAAKPKHLKNLKKIASKSTSVIPLPDCYLIFSFGTLVTVLDRTMLDGNYRASIALAEEATA